MAPVTASVLTTVNAPFREQLDALSLAHCISNIGAAQTKPGHVSVFFGEVSPQLQMQFAAEHEISTSELREVARAFAEYSGQNYKLSA